MAWGRKNIAEMDAAHEAHKQAMERESQARRDGKSAAEIRRLARESVESARVFNRAASSK